MKLKYNMVKCILHLWCISIVYLGKLVGEGDEKYNSNNIYKVDVCKYQGFCYNVKNEICRYT